MYLIIEFINGEVKEFKEIKEFFFLRRTDENNMYVLFNNNKLQDIKIPMRVIKCFHIKNY